MQFLIFVDAYCHFINEKLSMLKTIQEFKKLSTTSVSDALDSLGVNGGIQGIFPQVSNTCCVGMAFTVQYQLLDHPATRINQAGNYIDEVPEHAVIVIDNGGRTHCTTWGEVLTQVAIKRGVAGTVIYGMARDIKKISELAYPLFSCGVFMQTGKNRVVKVAQQIPIMINQVGIKPNDLIFADNNGVIVVPNQMIHEVLGRAKNIELTENRIVQAVNNGMRLEEARKKYHYHEPWEAFIEN
jgi:regulator of RNase E activity RraA